MLKEKESQQRIQQIEELIRKIDMMSDPGARASAVELVQSLMDLHGAGIERMMEVTAQAGEPGLAIIDEFARDDLVGSLLLLYGLHPVALETRVLQSLDKVRPYLHSHGGNVEVLGIDDGVVRLRLQGSCKSCPSSAMTLKLAIEEAIYEAAPDVTAIKAEGVTEQPSLSGFIPLERARGKDHIPQPTSNGGGWKEVGGLASLAQGSVRTIEVGGRPILFCRLDETFYAYGNLCPGCRQSLQGARLEAASLVCSTCGQRYEVERAGRALDQSDLHLEPFPLLMEQGQAKVALPHLVTSQDVREQHSSNEQKEDRTLPQHDTSRDAPAHDSGTGKGEEKSSTEGKEAGRHDHSETHAGRPAGGSTARDSTSINPEDRNPKDPKSPKLPPA